MAFDIDCRQGDSASYSLELYASDGVGTWLSATDTVEGVYIHFDDDSATVSLSVTAVGDASTPATVVLPGPCGTLDAVNYAPAPGPGYIVVTKVSSGGVRESLSSVVTYNVQEL